MKREVISLPIQQRLNLGGIDIVLCSRKPQTFPKDNSFSFIHPRNFFFNKKSKPDIVVVVDVVERFPSYKSSQNLFFSYQGTGKNSWWRLQRNSSVYIYECYLLGRRQLAFISLDFRYAKVFLNSSDNGITSWSYFDLRYTFLEVLLINYLAIYKKGILLHCAAVADARKRGVVFAGASGTGKTTLAKIWFSQFKDEVLNDDRAIIVKDNKSYLLYSSIWPGVFSKYFSLSLYHPVLLKHVFFLEQGLANGLQPLTFTTALNKMLTVSFLPFWDKNLFANSLLFCEELLSRVSFSKMKFKKSPSVVYFVKSLVRPR